MASRKVILNEDRILLDTELKRNSHHHLFTSHVSAYSGSKDELLHERRNPVIEQVSENYRKVDSHVRARSVLDCTVVIEGVGKIDFYPPSLQTVQSKVEPKIIGTVSQISFLFGTRGN